MTLIDPEKILRLLRESTGKDNDEIAVRFRPGSLNPGHHSIYASLYYLISKTGELPQKVRIDAALYDVHYDGNPTEYSVGFYSVNDTKEMHPAGDPDVQKEIVSLIHSNYEDAVLFIQDTIKKMRKGEIPTHKLDNYDHLVECVSSIPGATDIVYNKQYYPECSFVYKNKCQVTLKYYRKTNIKKESFTLKINSLNGKGNMIFLHVPGKDDIIQIIESHYRLLNEEIIIYKPYEGYILSESVLLDCGIEPSSRIQGGTSHGEILLTEDNYGPSIKITLGTKFDSVTKKPYFNTKINYYNEKNNGITQSSASYLSVTSIKKFIKNWITVFENDHKNQADDTF